MLNLLAESAVSILFYATFVVVATVVTYRWLIVLARWGSPR